MSNSIGRPYDHSSATDQMKIKQQFLIIEHMRDFIVWLCEEECNSTVTEMEEEFRLYEEKLEKESQTNAS
jgi:hypothetical protein